MGTIYRNGVPFAGSFDAGGVNYDNSSSGLSATNVQAAVDEVNGKVDDNAEDIIALNNGLSNVPVNFLGGVSTLPSILKDGLFGFSTTTNITVSGTTLPAGTRCFGVFYYGIGHCIGIANSTAVYTLRLAGGAWSLLATK